ncbi:Ig-like domain-containing protein, partial [Mycolicibacterium arenosum]
MIFGLPGVAVKVVTTVVATLLSPFLAPGPAGPAQPPVVLFAVLDWVRREISRTFFNNSPHAVVDAVTTSEDVSTTIRVLANDSDADTGDIVTVTGVTQPGNGTALLNSDGTLTYTPAPNFSGVDSFEYTISDAASPWHVHGLAGFFTGGGHTDTITVNVVVTPINDPPVAVDDTASTSEEHASVGNVLVNDTDVDTPASGLSAVLATGPANGTATIGPTGAYVYTPNADFTGTDSFTYVVSDGALSDTGKVTVTVTPINDPPIAVNDTISVDEDSIANPINVLANDTDPDTGDTRTVDQITQGAHGTVLKSGNSVLYTPNANFNGTDTFTYTVSDRDGATATATVTITVTPINDPPIAVNDTISVDEDSIANPINVLANDTDPDTGDTRTVDQITQGAHGTVLKSGNSVLYTPNANFNGTDTFTYTISDRDGATATATVTITVTPINDTPTANPDTITTDEDTPVLIDALRNDTDPDGDTLDRNLVTAPTNGTLTEINDGPDAGAWTYTPNPGFHGTDTFTYTATDGVGVSTTATVTINVTPVNDAPVANPDEYSTLEDTPLTVSIPNGVTGNDSYPDDDTALTTTVVDPPVHGTLNLNTNGTFTYTPATNFNGTDTFTYTISDRDGATATATVTITVTPINDTPTANPDTITTDEDTPVLIDALRNDTDPDGDTLDRNLVTAPTNGTLTEINDGPDAGAWTYTPNPDFHGTDTFTYTATDGVGVSTTATVTINVTPVNDAPVANPDEYSTLEDTPLTVSIPNGVTGNDSDPDDDTALTTTVVDPPVHGTLNLNTNGTFTYTPATNFNGTDTFTYRVTDGAFDSNPTTVTITVTAVNDIPVANPDTYMATEDTATSLNVTSNDVDGDGDLLFIATVSEPAHGTLTQQIGSLTYTPDAQFNGTDSFTYTVTDGFGFSNTATVTINVTPVNDAPVANPDEYSTLAGTPLTVSIPNGVTGNDSDPDDDTALTATVVDPPVHGTLNLNTNGTFTYTPATNFNGTDTFTYRVTDGALDSNPTTVTVTVISPIIAADDSYTVLMDTSTVLFPTPTANDSTYPGTRLDLGAITVVTAPTHGMITQTGDTVTYRPFNGYRGT